MYDKILLPTDGSALAGKAVMHGIALAKRLGAEVIVVTVSPAFHTLTADGDMIEDTPASYRIRMQRNADDIFAVAALAAKAATVVCDIIHVQHDHPYLAIIDTAETKGCGLIVMASHGRRGISALVLGSETMKVLTHCKVPVLVHR